MTAPSILRKDVPSIEIPHLRTLMPEGTRLDDLHELRVRIPTDLHRQLLSLKVLRGKSLAETVALALDKYFERDVRDLQLHAVRVANQLSGSHFASDESRTPESATPANPATRQSAASSNGV